MSGSVPCRACGLPVPPGRLACPSCGTLVAAPATSSPESAPPMAIAVEEAAAPSDVMTDDEPKGDEVSAADAPMGVTPVVPIADGPADADVAPEPLEWPAAPAGAALDTPVDVAALLSTAGEPPAAAALNTPEPADQPADEPADQPAPATVAADGLASGGVVPGAYLPPATVHRADAAPGAGYGPLEPSASSEPARWVPPGSPAPASPSAWVPPVPTGAPPPPPSAAAANAAAASARRLTPGKTSMLADLPFDAPDELEGWLVALGGGIAALGFFLPWTAALGTGLDGYFGSWGLGIFSHLPIFVFLVIVTALAILPNRVAAWVKTGVSGMVGGGISFGIVWLYLGSDASQLGALLTAVGSVLLIVGGIISVAPGRSARRADDA